MTRRLVVSSWDRRLWGVVVSTNARDSTPFLIGEAWDEELRNRQLRDDGPSRALLFTTRAAARAWCARQHAEWRAGRRPHDPVAKWRARPVRVREQVYIEDKKP